MENLKYINEKADIKIGDVLKHKSDGRRMVVVDFDRPDDEKRLNYRDKNKPICRFFHESTQKYDVQSFLFAELMKIEE